MPKGKTKSVLTFMLSLLMVLSIAFLFGSGKIMPYAAEDEILFYATGDTDTESATKSGSEAVKKIESEIVNISVEKIWDDEDNKLGKRPKSIKIHLLADGVVIMTKEITAADQWQGSFNDLPRYNKKDRLIEYNVIENEVFGYTVSIMGSAENGFKVRNTINAASENLLADRININYPGRCDVSHITLMLIILTVSGTCFLAIFIYCFYLDMNEKKRGKK